MPNHTPFMKPYEEEVKSFSWEISKKELGYKDGDIMLSFRLRLIYELHGEKKDWRDIIANDNEKNVFVKHFLKQGKTEATFADLKIHIPDFNAKEYKSRVYGYIEMDEYMYLVLKRKFEMVQPQLKQYTTNRDLVKEILADNIRLRYARREIINHDVIIHDIDAIIADLIELKRKF